MLVWASVFCFFLFFLIKFLKGSISANTASEIKAKLSVYFNLLPLLCLSYDPLWASQVMVVVKNLPANAGAIRDMGSIPGSGRYPGGGNGKSI